MSSIDNAMKAKLNNYNLVKGSLTQMQRKKLYDLIRVLNLMSPNVFRVGEIYLYGHWRMLLQRTTSSKTLIIWKHNW